ncbi:hydroxysteroid dehydrogenase-like protein 2 [Strongylocentrotus purpuratus]|uniref:Hydroxysteroid dehydrogenase-like protein 2 n=1 Tax=Strongylocentrotus purpuratus TaxID=7668 RepID=A0A7M7T419_STRPU|nr:hydroxysteroid dehydrogenase-like protein 2 [Strongylocentrotus purpuratus]|eukprot:XP_787338.3 PREDICTED: hydroxysteroid dehydrogenase-like protein 2 [Strongylocentrotus purpuratus]
MINTGKLAGRTLFITGASRGIGKAIALKAARDGANVVIAAKTAEAHPKLPGTIYTAAEEVEKLGGKCLPCIVDIREESQVISAVEEAVKKFGGIDILVNNASAISLTDTDHTPMKKYDLMNSVNARGTYMCSRVCLPYLRKGTNPHILNLSPPLNFEPKWFRGHVAYSIAKYGMSLCVLGMAEEFKADGIAVNALWPRTAIWTAAMQMIGGESDSTMKSCRSVDIITDAAYAIFSKDSSTFTGNYCIDDEIVRAEGITDLGQYSCVKGEPLLLDFFVDPDPKAKPGEFIDAIGAEEALGGGGAEAGAGAVPAMFDKMGGMLSESHVQKIGAVFQFELSGNEPGTWHLDLKNGSGSAGSGPPSNTADATLSLDSADFIKMFEGKIKATVAFMGGKLKIKGDMMKAMKLEKLMDEFNKLPAAAAAPKAEPVAAAAASGGSGGQIDVMFTRIRELLSEEMVGKIGAVYQFDVSGEEAGSWTLDLKNGSGSANAGAAENPDVTMILDTANFIKMFQGKMNPTMAFMGGKLKIKGDLGKAMKLEGIMKKMQSKL